MEELDKIFQVSEFNEFIDVYLRQSGDVIVEGELSEFNVSKGKWIYATIKDEDSSVGIFGTVFKITNAKQLEPGIKVHVHGVPGLYQKSGRFNLQADQIVPVGEGALQAMFEKLKIQLEKEGLFAEDRKREIIDFPETIGLITAKGSQAYKDFIKVTKERMGGIKINFYPVNVQGKNSIPSIVRAFDYFNENYKSLDALVLIRGGGSLEDLISFNDEAVVRAIFSSKFPVICGVGHEGDITLADLVADLRASTPSNAAELLTRERNETIREVDFMLTRIENNIDNMLYTRKNQIAHAFNIIDSVIKKRMNEASGLITQFEQEIRYFEQGLIQKNAKINSDIKELLIRTDNAISQEQRRLYFLTRTLKNMDHRELLKRGYSITTDSKGKIIKKKSQAKKDSNIETTLSDGKIISQVQKTV